ncbi:MAG: aldehyde ferredoxin oxidoreductase family protein [Clostridia bacterium]
MGLQGWINLTDGTVELKKTKEEEIKKYLGGRALAAKVLYENVGVEVKPYDPENMLIFSTGAFSGTPWPSAARYTVTAKSPATGAYGYANSSGHFGPELHKAGFDLLVMQGKAAKPAYLLVEDDKITIHDASELWGKDTEETEKILTERYPGSKVAEIGVAGENLVRFAAVINDYGRAAARTGMGAVMGSKNLKAIVVKSTKKVEINPKFMETIKRVTPLVKDHPASVDYREWGTVLLLNFKNYTGDNPARNHQYGQMLINGEITAQSVKNYTIKNQGCFACSIRCARITEVKDGPFKTPVQEGPEYETSNALGANVWNHDTALLIHCNYLCNKLGIDTISAGGVIAFAMEAHEKGVFQDDKYNYNWGDSATIIGLLNDITNRVGVGDILANGVKEASEHWGKGSDFYAMQVKGVEIPRQEGRAWKSFGLAHATSNRGADHLYALPTIDGTGNKAVADRYLSECGPELMDPTNEAYNGTMTRFTEACNCLADALGICKFAFTETFAILPEDLAEGMTALGYEMNEEDILNVGRRVVNLERMYNIRHGMSRKDDTMPRRSLEEPLYVFKNPEDAGIIPIEEAEIAKVLTLNLDVMLDEYYEKGQWTAAGIPTAARLEQLGLGFCVKDLP